MAHEPIVHVAPGTDPKNQPAGTKHIPGAEPVVHAAPGSDDAAAQTVVTHGMSVAQLFDALQIEADKRKAAPAEIADAGVVLNIPVPGSSFNKK
jgi:hypothetical protein